MTHHFFGKFQFSSWSQRGPAMPLPTTTKMVLKELSTSSQLLQVGRYLQVLRRTCYVKLGPQFLVNKSKDIGLKLNNGTCKKQKKGRRLPLPGDNRSAVCKGVPDGGRKKRKEH